MLLLYLGALLLIAGEIYSSPTVRSFYFEYEFDGRETKSAFLRYSVVLNCTTNDPSADVRLAKLSLPDGQANLLSQGGRLTRKGPVFTIHNLIWKDAGRYKCVAVKDGQEISREIDLVLDNPDVLGLKIIPFRQQTVLSGTYASYTCDASSGTVLWYKVEGSGSILLPSTRFPEIKVVPDRIYESRKKDLVFTNANLTHSGRYKCELTAQSIIMKKFVLLAVSGPRPVKIVSPSRDVDYLIKRGTSSHYLRCVAEGLPLPKITWKKDGKAIRPCLYQGPHCRYVQVLDGLNITQLQHHDDEGVYQCVARNERGSTDRRKFRVGFPAAPQLLTPHQTQFSWTIGTQLSCVALRGNPEPTFQWRFQFCFSDDSCAMWKDAQVSSFFRIDTRKSHSTLTIKKNSHISGMFKLRCMASNTSGNDELDYIVFN